MTTELSGNSVSKEKKGGFTLVEVMVALALGLMIIAAIMSALIFMIGSSLSVSNYIDMNKEGRIALEIMGRDIRNATAIDDGFSANEFRIHVLQSDQTTTPVTYRFDPSNPDRELTRASGDEERIIVRGLDELSFRYYDLQGGEVKDYALPVRQVQIQMTSVREKRGMDNTDRIISARYILRNKHVTN